MCNIAGYAGYRAAAPVLLEMLRRQQHYDGSLSTGIATIHEGKLYCKKVLGDVDAFLAQVDLNELPGTIGIAHSRPGNDYIENAHPTVSNSGKIAVVSNGTTKRDFRIEKRSQVAQLLEAEGYTFPLEQFIPDSKGAKLRNGNSVHLGYVIANRVESHMKQGLEFEEAMASTVAEVFGERVSVAIHADVPDRICVARQTRPMELLMAEGENYIATTRFGFPEDVKGTVMSLPVLRICTVQRDGVHLTPHAIQGPDVDGVCEITPGAYRKAYQVIEDFLRGKKDAPVNLDQIEFELEEHPDIFHEKYDYAQYAKILYDILYQLRLEGRLHTVLEPRMTEKFGLRNYYLFWLD